MMPMYPIGVCIISPSYKKVGAEAVRRFENHVGLEVKIHECDDKDGFDAKLQLDRICGKRPVIFFDSDLWFLDRPNLEKSVGHPCLMAAHDSAAFNPHAFPHTDCERFGMPKTEYFNSGLMCLSFDRENHRNLFSEARRLKRAGRSKKAVKPADLTDQFWLNKARLNIGLPWVKLPTSHNFYLRASQWGQLPFIPRKIIGLHGAGIKTSQKYAKLKQQAKVFEYPTCAMHPETLAMQHAITFDLR